MRRALRYVVIVLALFVLYLLLWPVEIDPVAWQPPKAPEMAGRYAPNDKLKSVERLGEGAGVGPEDVAIDAQGRLYGGMVDGRIIRFSPDGSNPKEFANTGGRPLGLAFDKAGNLIVADAMKGLLSVAPDGTITVLTTKGGDKPLNFTDDVDVAADGTIYFSDASWKFPYGKPTADIFEHRGNGRLLAYDPKDKSTKVLVEGLQFANGIAVSPDQRFVLVVETGSYRIRRHWLKGPKKGKTEIFIDNLPGFPDGVSSNGRGTFWVALFSPRVPTADQLASLPFVRRIIWRLPESMQPKPIRYSFVLGLDAKGKVTHNLQDPAGTYSPITSVEEHGGKLYLGSLTEPAIGRIKAP